jgi:hypothetical protein
MRVGVTLYFRKNLGDYNSASYEVAIEDVDPEGDVEAQIAKAMEALTKVEGTLEDHLTEKVTPSK